MVLTNKKSAAYKAITTSGLGTTYKRGLPIIFLNIFFFFFFYKLSDKNEKQESSVPFYQ